MTRDKLSPEPIVREIRVAAPPKEVFRFFTDPDKMVLWHARSAWMQARRGGEFRIDVNGLNTARGEFIVRSGHVLTMDESLGDIPDGDVHVRNGESLAVG